MLAAVVLSAIPGFAQGNSVVQGRVTDASNGNPVADVVVMATSPALLGEQIVVTDATGQYRLPNLPPGDYTLSFQKETYRPATRGGIALRSAVTIRVDMQVLPEAVQASEEIVVVGRAPTVDVGSSSTGQNINQDFTRRIAVAPPAAKGGAQRSFEAVAEVAPGAKSDTYGTSINGTTSPENQYVIDGVSVNDPAFGVVGTPLTVEFIKEVNVVSGGYMPEFGRSTGGVLDVVTKSGGNEFHGSVFFNLTPGAFEGPREKVRREGSTILAEQELGNIRDYGFEVGGPILKDKLWFFVGADVAFTTRRLRRYLNRVEDFDENAADDTDTPTGDNPGFGNPLTDESGFTRVSVIPGSERVYEGNQQVLQYIGKLTYQVNQDNSLSLSVYGSPIVSGGNGNIGIDAGTGGLETTAFQGSYSRLAHKYVDTSTDVALKWSSAFNNKRLLIDATVGWHHQNNDQLASDGTGPGDTSGLAAVPGVNWRRSPRFHSIQDFESLPAGAGSLCATRDIAADRDGDGAPDDEDGDGVPDEVVTLVPCAVQTYASGGPGQITAASLDRFQGKAIVTSLFEAAGHHVVKGGIDAEIMTYTLKKAWSGSEIFRESLGGATFSDFRMYGFNTGPDLEDYVIQDVLTSESLSTTFGGFLQDSWSILDKVTLNVGVRYDAQYLISGDGKLGMALPNQWSPRVGVVYDITQEGRSKLFANYARYYESVPLDIVDRSFGNERQITSIHDGSTCDPRDPEQATGEACQSDTNRIPFGSSFDPSQYWFTTGGQKTPIDPDVSPQSSDEIVIGGEYEVIPNGRVGVQYTKRWMNSVIEDMSRDEANTYFVGNPGEGMAKDFPKAERDYDAVTLFFQKGFADLWLAQVSYSVSYLRGNYAGLFRPETGQLDPNINSDFDLVSLLPNRSGPLPGDRTHEFKVFGAKAFAIPGGMMLDLGLTFRTRSGAPSNYNGSHPLYGGQEVYILPRGSGERLPWVHNLDGRIGYSLDLAKDSQLTISMDVFNLFNFQEITAIDENYTNADVLPCVDQTVEDLETSDPSATCLKYTDGSTFDFRDKNPNFGNPTQYQAPRTFRFGARVTF